jgi:hypothetical protein
MDMDTSASYYPRWYVEIGYGFKRCEEWEELAFNNAVGKGEDVVEYVFPLQKKDGPKYVKYIVDLREMTQTNTYTGYVRKILYFASDMAHTMLSPYVQAADGRI